MALNGILNVNKQPGITSHDVVSRVRRAVVKTKVGHAGTLDPLATGVLIVLVGQAVRISEYVMDLPKTYRTEITLGVTTDTYDADGSVTSESTVDVSESELRTALQRFVGQIDQTPPPYSAARVDGERAYRLARRGTPTAPTPRLAHVYRIEVLAFDPPSVEIEVECAKGTYIRSIAHDLGLALGCGAHVKTLQRTRVGPFDLDSSIDSTEIADSCQHDRLESLLRPMDLGLAHIPSTVVEIEDEKDLRHGQPAFIKNCTLNPQQEIEDGLLVRGYAEDGSLIGLVRFSDHLGMWRPHKIFK